MPIVIYELVRRLFLPVILPLFVAFGFYLKGCSDGRSRCEESQREAQEKIEGSLRKAEEKNEKIKDEQARDRVRINSYDRPVIVCLFNSYFGTGSARSCYPVKADTSVN